MTSKEKWRQIKSKRCQRRFCIDCLMLGRQHPVFPSEDDTAEMIGLLWIEAFELDVTTWDEEKENHPIVKKIIRDAKNDKKLACSR
jgi:hypothetical protein